MINLSDIEVALKKYTTREQFDSWLIPNERDLSNFFYKLSGYDLNDLRFDNFYYDNISTSKVYAEYHNTSIVTKPFSFFLNLISVAAEKLAEVGIDSFSQAIVVDLPESQSKYRLVALNHFALVEDIRTDYITSFSAVLGSLDKSRLLFEEENIRKIIDVLVYYYKKAKTTLEAWGFTDIIAKLNDLFRDATLIKKYPFLSHQILVDLINGVDPFALYPEVVTRERLEPSESIRSLFNKINMDFFGHPEIDYDNNNLWGYTKKKILDEVIIRGRGDFSKSYGRITADDKVLLYCFFNMKKHFFTSYAVFQTVINSLATFFKNDEYKPVFIDLGCGPMTSGLAMADVIHTNSGKSLDFSYIGVDISNAMLAKASSFTDLNIFSPNSNFSFVNNWNDIDFSFLHKLAGKNNPIIFNASYLFASSSVDPFDLCRYIKEVVKNFVNVFFVFQNPNRDDRNIKYDDFRSCMSATSIIKEHEDIRYKAASVEANEDVAYEILKL